METAAKLFTLGRLTKVFSQKGLEPLVRIELTTSSLPRKCSTPELQRLVNRRFRAASERETSLELATYSLEGYRSTN
ncbi:MAG: hypothetical protein RJB31_671 [Bacteroidota bacterium]